MSAPASDGTRGMGAAERALLLHLLALEPTADAPSLTGVAWPAILDYTAVSLSPLVLRGLSDGRIRDAVPAWVLERLRSNHRALAARYLRRQGVFREVIEALSGAGIPVLVLKGAALAHLVYPDPVLRPMTDLDLWLPPQRLDDAVRVLAAVGFATPASYALSLPSFAPADRAPTRSIESAGVPPVEVELHGQLRSLSDIPWADFEQTWSVAEPVNLNGVVAHVLSPPHFLTHLGLHLARGHAYSRSLLTLVDIARLTRYWSERWDWPAMVAGWRRDRVLAWMLLSLVLARDLVGAPVPADLESVGGPPGEWARMRALAEAQVWEGRGRPTFQLVRRLMSARESGRLRALRQRLVDHYWRSPDPGRRGRLGAGVRRLWHDLRVKVPRYLLDWRAGTLRAGIALEKNRHELEQLVVAGGDQGLPGPSQAERPDGGDRAIATGPGSG